MAVKAASKRWWRGGVSLSDEAREESDMRRRLMLQGSKGQSRAQSPLRTVNGTFIAAAICRRAKTRSIVDRCATVTAALLIFFHSLSSS